MNLNTLKSRIGLAMYQLDDEQLRFWVIRNPKKLGFTGMDEMITLILLAGGHKKQGSYYTSDNRLVCVPGRFSQRTIYPLTLYYLLTKGEYHDEQH